jgi:serine/threonine protein kinase
VHRDLKPDNIMVLPARGLLSRERVKLLDFGIAKLTQANDASPKLTQAGLVLGTPRYISPEQAMGKETDARSDLYSCGVILYEVLTGQAPFESVSTPEVLTMHLTATPKPLRAVAPSARLSAAIETAVLRVLAKEPAQRFQSARELCVALERAAKEPDQQPDTSGLRAAARALGPARASSSSRWILVQRLVLALLGAARAPLRDAGDVHDNWLHADDLSRRKIGMQSQLPLSWPYGPKDLSSGSRLSCTPPS